ncbi:MAG: slipin family protein, partial [Chloroflexota bacterium]
PGELKRAYASVLAARKEGEAALERARGETAALRNLANAGRLVETNPGLLQLRMLQELGASSGNTIVMGLPDTTTVVPRSAARRSVRETNDSRQP